jgi:ADP-ribose pyrophosphatase
MDHQRWRTRSIRKVFESGKWVSIEHHEVELPDGRVIPDWPWIETPPYINVVPVTPDGRIFLFRQYKYAFEKPSLALVGGYIEPGEEPLVAAQRELLEETGFQAREWRSLGSYWVDPNRGVAMGYFYLAIGANPVTLRNADDLEEQEPVALTFKEAADALVNGEILVQAWALCLALALRALESRPE